MPAPRPVPPETKVDPSSSRNDGTSSQKLMLFMRGKAMSGAPIISGTNQLPKPPIIAGMTVKKTMISPCAVISTFQWWVHSSKFAVPAPIGQARLSTWMPGSISSQRMIPEMRAADHAGDDREDQIERADVLVVGRHEPADEEARLVVRIMMRVMRLVRA